ncbi:MAG: hypothetical protein ACXAC7_20840 [Candidatus Hodarchaeales archaeon]
MAKMTLGKVFLIIVLLSCLSGAFIFQGTGMSITITSVDAQSSDTPFKAIWTDGFNYLLENSSTVEGPHGKVKVSWPDSVDQVNLTYEKGKIQKTKTYPIRVDTFRTITHSFFVTKGDSYNITRRTSGSIPTPLGRNTLQIQLLDPTNHDLEEGCSRSDYTSIPQPDENPLKRILSFLLNK